MTKKILKNPLYLAALAVAAYFLVFKKKKQGLPGVTVNPMSIPSADPEENLPY